MSDDIFQLVLKGTLEQVKLYLDTFEENITEKIDLLGGTLLHLCVVNSKVDIMQGLLHFAQSYPKPVYNTWLEYPNKEGLPVLLLAVVRGNLEAVQTLVQYNANIYAKTPLGLDVIHLCAQGNNAQILVFFHEIRFLLSNTDNKGGTPLHWAAYMGSFNVLVLLISLKVNKNIRDAEGRTALHLAVMAGNEKVVRKLIIAGVNAEIKDKKNRTPLMVACESNSTGIIKMLAPANLVEKLGCKQKITKPVRTSANMAVLLMFICFSFVFIMFFCAKSMI